MNRVFCTIIFLSLSFSLFGQEISDSSRITFPPDSSVVMDSTYSDSLFAISDSLAKPKPDTLKPIFYSGILGSSASYFSIYKEELNREDYRSFGDLANYLPGGFYENPGLLGHTGEIYIHGLGYQELTAAIDGMNINNRFTNTYNFHNFDYENVKNIEIPSITKGFIYNMEGNPAYINFVNTDTIRGEPYTRVRYFQGPDDEGLVNGYFSRVISGRLSGNFGFSNVQSGQRYDNSDAGGWTASARLKYVYNNNLNFFASYNFYNTQSELNGGVDIAKVEEEYLPQDWEEVIFNPRAAEVVFPYQSFSLRYAKYQGERYNFRTIARFLGLFYTQLDVEYAYNKIKFRQNERGINDYIPVRIADNADKSFVISLRQKFTTSLLKLDLLASYRNETIEATNLTNIISDNYFLSADALFEPFRFVNLDLFVKTGRYRKYNINGSGLIATISPIKNLRISGGTSYSEQAQPYTVDVFTSESKPVRNLINEIALSFNSAMINLRASLHTVNKDNYYMPYTDGVEDTTQFHTLSGYVPAKYFFAGANLYAKLKWHFLELFLNPSYNFTQLGDDDENKFLPDLTFEGGIYYSNIHFNNNLNIKTGFNFRFNTAQLYSIYDYEYNERIFHTHHGVNGFLGLMNSTPVKGGLQIDFMLVGELQQSAIVYFAFENILDENHYVLPYYPMYPRGFRIGFNWKLYN